jgi:flagellum-specific ATP synthase
MTALQRSLAGLVGDIERIPEARHYGRVATVLGMLVEVAGLDRHLSVGSRCDVVNRTGQRVPCEVVGFRAGRALAMSYGALDGVGLGCRAELVESDPLIRPTRAWLGRVVNAFGEPIDGKGPLPSGIDTCRVRNAPPPAHARKRVGGKLDLGVRAINSFLTCCRGQRMGIFAGSGVGKSVLLSMLARYTASDVNVIGLIGERGREVQEFIHDDLGEDGLARSVVVVATSDESPLMRRQAAQLTLALAEFFRDEGDQVLCLIDSITRFAMAMREIGLSAGEPPASKGYTPSVFAELPRLLERAGPGTGEGTITGLFTVLVEGDDHNEPIADAVRGILDGHIWLDRSIAERGRYPAVNVLRSISRTMPGCNSEAENALVKRARGLLAAYDDMAELIRLGAYKKGSDAVVDEAIALNVPLEAFLTQDKNERTDLATGYGRLAEILSMPAPGAETGPAGPVR